MDKQILGLEQGLLANMAFALDMVDEIFTAPDYMNIMAYADEIANELPEDKKNMLALAMILTAHASEALTMFMSKCTEEEWREKVKNWCETHKDKKLTEKELKDFACKVFEQNIDQNIDTIIEIISEKEEE